MESKQIYELDLGIENIYFYQRIMLIILYITIVIIFDMGDLTWIFFILFFSVWFYYRGIFIKKIKIKTKVSLYDNFILLETPFYKKEINYLDIKNMCYIENRPTVGYFIINITPTILDYKYLLLMKNFYNSKKYKSLIIPDVKNAKKIYEQIKNRKIKNDISYNSNILNSKKSKFIILKNYIEVISLKNESKISFFEGASYDIGSNKLKLSKQIGFIIQYRRTKLPSLDIR